MLQDMENMEATSVFYVKGSTFTHLENSKTSLLTVNQSGMVMLIVQDNLIVSVSFMDFPGDNFRQTSAYGLALEQYHIFREQSCHFSGRTV